MVNAMKLTLKIVSKNVKPFKGQDGKMIDYTWYKGEREDNQLTIDFGSKNSEYEEGEVYTLDLEKREGMKGFVYREVANSNDLD